jgi:glycerol-3-phosphate dehydrogenase
MEVEPALAAIAGGKFTTYRVMAEDAVDFVLGDDAKDRRSLTESVPLLGAQGVGALRRGPIRDRGEVRLGTKTASSGSSAVTAPSSRICSTSLMTIPSSVSRWKAPNATCASRPTTRPQQRGPSTSADILERRMRLNYEAPDRGKNAAEAVAAIVAPVLGWGRRSAVGRG